MTEQVERVEKVARALWGSFVGGDRIRWEDRPALHAEYLDAARAAIAAMRKDAAMDRLVAEGQRCDAMTPQEAAKVLLKCDDNGSRKPVYDACDGRLKVYKFDAVLRAISEDSHE